MPTETLVRELAEELGIAVRPEHCGPVGFAENGDPAQGPRLVILLYMVTAWEGEPRALEGGVVGWFTARESLALPKPPLDVDLAERLFQNR